MQMQADFPGKRVKNRSISVAEDIGYNLLQGQLYETFDKQI